MFSYINSHHHPHLFWYFLPLKAYFFFLIFHFLYSKNKNKKMKKWEKWKIHSSEKHVVWVWKCFHRESENLDNITQYVMTHQSHLIYYTLLCRCCCCCCSCCWYHSKYFLRHVVCDKIFVNMCVWWWCTYNEPNVRR